MGPMLFYLHRTDLSEEELASVCAGNLARILGLAATSVEELVLGEVEGRVAS